MHGSKLPLKTWDLALYILTTGLKGTSSMKLDRDMGVTQKTAWHLAHRICKAWDTENVPFTGPVEVDETLRRRQGINKHRGKKLKAGRGPVRQSEPVDCLLVLVTHGGPPQWHRARVRQLNQARP